MIRSTSWLTSTIRKPGFWLIAALLALITLPHYQETLQHPAFLTNIMSNLGLTRHSFERILYLGPIVWAGFLFGWKGTVVTSLVAFALMLPRALFISPRPLDAIFETSAVFIIGNVLAIAYESLRKEREHRIQLEKTQQELRVSEERYRGLFENAHDAISLNDLEGNIIAANEACVTLTGYNFEELCNSKASELLSEDSLPITVAIERRLLRGETTGCTTEVKLIRKDGSEADIQLAISLVISNGEPLGFQHIARDVTQQKRMQENLHYYLQQATRAQEEERKRIARELHDETIQDLVVLSRQLDVLASRSKELSDENNLMLKELRQKTKNIIQAVRRLSQDLRPAALDQLGLLPALDWLAADVTKYSGIATKVNVIGTERRLSEEIELMLFRITQEALRNVWRHSQATRAEITVKFDNTKTRVTVNDNGKGFNLPGTMGDLPKEGKLGLAGMQERARLMGGTLMVQSEPGKGTTVTVEVLS